MFPRWQVRPCGYGASAPSPRRLLALCTGSPGSRAPFLPRHAAHAAARAIVGPLTHARAARRGLAKGTVDAIFLSSHTAMLALPYITERTAFRGIVYATEPTLQFGQQLMEAMVEHHTRSHRAPSKVCVPLYWLARRRAQKLYTLCSCTAVQRLAANVCRCQSRAVRQAGFKTDDVLAALSGNAADAQHWERLYTADEAAASIQRCSKVAYNEKLSLLGDVLVTAHASG